MGAQIDSNGGLQLTLANPRGDAVTSVELTAGQGEATPATAITAWSDYTEYGTPTNPDSAATVGGPVGYGFLGGKQRSTTAATAGLTLMGDRLYNSVRGLFTSLDPEPGGNENAYNYPNDPINAYDLDGHWTWKEAVISGMAFALNLALGAAACGTTGAVVYALCRGVVGAAVGAAKNLAVRLWARGEGLTRRNTVKAVTAGVLGFIDGVTGGFVGAYGLKVIARHWKSIKKLLRFIFRYTARWLRNNGWYLAAAGLMKASGMLVSAVWDRAKQYR